MSGAVPRIFPKGTPVQVLQSKNGWLRVEERDSAAIGWVYGSLLK
jgi:SH3-like domain-containing protein